MTDTFTFAWRRRAISPKRACSKDTKLFGIIIKSLNFSLRCCARSGAGETQGGGTVRFVFYKASLGNYVTMDQSMKEQRLGTQVPRGRDGRVGGRES